MTAAIADTCTIRTMAIKENFNCSMLPYCKPVGNHLLKLKWRWPVREMTKLRIAMKLIIGKTGLLENSAVLYKVRQA